MSNAQANRNPQRKPYRRPRAGSTRNHEDDRMESIFSGSVSSVSSAESKRDEFVPVNDVVALEEGIPAHEQVFDSLSGLRSELFNKPHLPNEEDTSIIVNMITDLNEETLHLAHDLCNSLTKHLYGSGNPYANLNTPLKGFTRNRDLGRVAKALKAQRYVKTAIQHYRRSSSDFTVDYLLEPMVQHALLGYLIEDVFCHFIPVADSTQPGLPSITFDDPVRVLYQRLRGANRRLAGTWRAVAYLAATDSRDLTRLVHTKSSLRLEELRRAFSSFESNNISNSLSLDKLMMTFSLRLQRIYQTAWAIQDKIRIAYLDIDFSVFLPTTGKQVDHRSMRLAPEHHTCPTKRCTIALNARLGLRSWRKRVNTIGVVVTEDIVFLKPDVLCAHSILNN